MTQLPSDQTSPEQLTPGQQKRRTTLKLLTGGAAGVVLPSAIAFAGHSADKAGNQSVSDLSTEGQSNQLPKPSLKIEIFTGKSTPEDTVLLSSTADHAVTLKQFMPGLLAIADRTIDLNQLLVTGALTIGAGASKSAWFPGTLRQSDMAMQEYLSAESALEVVGEGTEIITVSALVDADGMAVVYVPQAIESTPWNGVAQLA